MNNEELYRQCKKHIWDGPEEQVIGYKKGENPISSIRVLEMTKTCSKCGMKKIDWDTFYSKK